MPAWAHWAGIEFSRWWLFISSGIRTPCGREDDSVVVRSVLLGPFFIRPAQQAVPYPHAGQVGGVGGRFEPVVLRDLAPVVLVAGGPLGKRLQILVGQQSIVHAAFFGSATGRRELRGELINLREQIQARGAF